MIVTIAILAILVFILANKYRIRNKKVLKDLTGKVALVTGANTGIGLEVARALAERKCRVLLGCRNVAKGEAAVKDIVRSTGNDKVELCQLDVGSFDSVREFCQSMLDNETQLDILVNNAAVMTFSNTPIKIDEYGLDVVLTTNHYGPFLLTTLLMPLILKSVNPRVVLVSSVTQGLVRQFNEDILRGKQLVGGSKMYGTSKLANVMYARELSERLRGTGVAVNSVHPGVVNTNIVRHLNWFLKLGFLLISPFFVKSAREGAEPVVYLAAGVDVEGVTGKYFELCQMKHENELARDNALRQKLWDISEEITGLKCT